MITKGEWIVHEWGDRFQVVEAQVRVAEKPGITMAGQLIIAKEITKANAQLIAAAPDLYEALKDSLSSLQGVVDNRGNRPKYMVDRINRVVEALAKAEG